MGFPQMAPEGEEAAVFVGADARLRSGAYVCPRCRARCRELPCQCHVCGLTLISSPALARSYHHLFPVQPFEEVPSAQLPLLKVRVPTSRGVVASSSSCRGLYLFVVGG